MKLPKDYFRPSIIIMGGIGAAIIAAYLLMAIITAIGIAIFTVRFWINIFS